MLPKEGVEVDITKDLMLETKSKRRGSKVNMLKSSSGGAVSDYIQLGYATAKAPNRKSVKVVEPKISVQEIVEPKRLDVDKAAKLKVNTEKKEHETSTLRTRERDDKSDECINVQKEGKIIRTRTKLILGVCVVSFILPFILLFVVTFRTKVPSPSMAPAIIPGDEIIVLRKWTTSNFKRGDILVFWSQEQNTMLIKRLIGEPNDLVEIRGTTVYVNGEALEESYVKSNVECNKSWLVPAGYYFFLGDNRAESLDSRYWISPFIPEEAIKGKAFAIVSPILRFKILS